MNTEEKYRSFPKIPRLNRGMIITEKLDGSNALVSVSPTGEVRAGSRNRWLSVDDDNFGFAQWVENNKDALKSLGHGLHWGEWWGVGIQRGYGLTERRFSLFNTSRWLLEDSNVPECCSIVPVLYEGNFDTASINHALNNLSIGGSYAAPGYRFPEGMVVYHVAGNHSYKVTLVNDAIRKTVERVAT